MNLYSQRTKGKETIRILLQQQKKIKSSSLKNNVTYNGYGSSDKTLHAAKKIK